MGRILIDNGSLVDILIWQCFIKIGLTEKDLKKSQYPLIIFRGKRIDAIGKIELNVTFGEGNTQRTEMITFDIVDVNYPYNTIFVRNTIVKFAAVIHQPYLCMKLPTVGGVLMVFGNQEEACRCEDNTFYTNKSVHTIESANPQETQAADSKDTEKPEGVSTKQNLIFLFLLLNLFS